MASETLNVLEGRWKNACKILFGKEACTLAECGAWLSSSVEPLSRKKSSISGKEVISAPTDYSAGASWLSFDEVDFSRKFAPLNINEIKDIDSIVDAIGERISYSGNVVFGKSGFIENSSNVNDSFYLYAVKRGGNSRYMAYCSIAKLNEDCFGCNGVGESAFLVKCSRSLRNKRCFETWMCEGTSDSYYSSGLDSCTDCMFSFNLQKARCRIGNLELPLPKYKEIREKLKAEMAEELSRKKSLPSLMDMVEKAQMAKPGAQSSEAQEQKDKKKIEAAFRTTTSIIFGKPLEGGIDAYSKWLTRHTRSMLKCSSAASGRDLYMPDAVNYDKLPRDRLLAETEAYALGRSARMSAEDAESLTLSNAHGKIGPFAFFNVEFFEGNTRNNIECAVCVEAVDNYRNSMIFYAKNSGYNFWPRDSDHIFGCDSPFSSSFSINCYSCTNQIRSFEIDCCGYCTDAYFSHNCENVNDSMFCFNTKNKRNAIGNAELPAPDYKKVKSLILGQIYDELSSKKDLKWDIYNVAGKSRD